jgi:hypothetical protein
LFNAASAIAPEYRHILLFYLFDPAIYAIAAIPMAGVQRLFSIFREERNALLRMSLHPVIGLTTDACQLKRYLGHGTTHGLAGF